MVQPSALSHDDLWRYAPDPEVYRRRAGAPAWLDELDLRAGAPFVKMGTRTADGDTLFVVDDAFEQEVALRRRLVAEQREVVVHTDPSVDAASEEVLELVTQWLRARDLPADIVDDHPLVAAALMVPDDLCLMMPRDGDWWFDAGVVCFPSIWRLVDKIGRPTTGVHSTVAHYHDELSAKVDRFFHGMSSGRMVQRRNLSVKPWHLLHVPTTKPDQPLGPPLPSSDGSPFWLRTERQTLQRLPRSGAILFTIKVQIAPAAVLLHRPDVARSMAAMYRSFDASMGGYKEAANDLEVGFVPWLEQVADGRP